MFSVQLFLYPCLFVVLFIICCLFAISIVIISIIMIIFTVIILESDYCYLVVNYLIIFIYYQCNVLIHFYKLIMEHAEIKINGLIVKTPVTQF